MSFREVNHYTNSEKLNADITNIRMFKEPQQKRSLYLKKNSFVSLNNTYKNFILQNFLLMAIKFLNVVTFGNF